MRIIATDLDGTLAGPDGRLSAYTSDVLAELDRRGVPVVIVTARPLRWMDDLWSAVGSHGLAILSNGAVVYDARLGRPTSVTGIEPELGLRITAAITAAVPGATYAVECLDGIRLDPTFAEPDPGAVGRPRGPLEEVWDRPALKLLVRAPEVDPEDLQHRVVVAVGDLATPTWSGLGLVEVGPPGVTKATTLAQVVADLGGSPADVIAFGDMPNDLPMLTWAGTSYAVANAHPDVLAIADEVAPAHDEDGVARVLAGLYGL